MRFRRSRGDLVFVEVAAEPVIPAKRGQVVSFRARAAIAGIEVRLSRPELSALEPEARAPFEDE
jgi:hypothetical protein